MFKNAQIFKINGLVNLSESDSALAASAFAPCGPTQEKSTGWVPPRGEDNGKLIEFVGNQAILTLETEVKRVPADAIKRMLKERCANIESSTGRKPGSKERRELKDEIKLELLPMAIATRKKTNVWIDPMAGRLVIDASSSSKSDAVIDLLIKSIPEIKINLIETTISPMSAMSVWLMTGEWFDKFAAGRSVELNSMDEQKAKVKFQRHELDNDEVRAHIEQGKLPTKLEMIWNDRVQFTLTEGLSVTKIEFLEGVFDGESQDKADEFDTSVAILTGELSLLLPDLFEALGGEVDHS